MAPRIRTLLPVLLLAVASPTIAISGVPSGPNSTMPPFLVTCPMGDIPFPVTVRDLANAPIAGSTVVLDFLLSPGAYFCTAPPPPYNQDLVSRTISGTTDATGKVTFPLNVGGTGGAGSVRLYADGVLIALYALASPDQTGNGVVFCYAIDTDCDVFSGKVGSADPTADFDGDGDVDDDDELILNQHGSHACGGFVDPARRSSWGRLKSIYR